MKDIKLICKLNKDWRLSNIKLKKAGGQTNRNWIVEHKNKKFFVRLPWQRADIVDRKVEAKNIFALSRNKKVRKILPKYYLYIYQNKNILQPRSKEIFEVPDGTMIVEHIPGRLFTMSLFRKEKYQEKLADMFYTFHTSGVRFVNKYNVFRDEIRKYRLAAKKYPIQQLINLRAIGKLENIEKEVERAILFFKKGISTHNDFIFQNFLVGENDKIYLLDFEYAGLNQKGGMLYDYGFLFADNFFRNPPISQELFEKFLTVADKIYKQPLNRNQIYWLAIAATLVMFWWGLVKYFSSKTKAEKRYFRDYVLKRGKGIEKLYHYIKKGVRWA
jgi:thiamine kinase-like enzyme